MWHCKKEQYHETNFFSGIVINLVMNRFKRSLYRERYVLNALVKVLEETKRENINDSNFVSGAFILNQIVSTKVYLAWKWLQLRSIGKSQRSNF